MIARIWKYQGELEPADADFIEYFDEIIRCHDLSEDDVATLERIYDKVMEDKDGN